MLFKKLCPVILYNEIQSYEDKKIYYTSDREKQLIRCIKMGLSDEVEVILNEIYKVNFLQRQISYDKLKRLIYSISLSVYDNILYVCNYESFKIRTVNLKDYTVKDYKTFDEPVYRYIKTNDRELVELESGVYML